MYLQFGGFDDKISKVGGALMYIIKEIKVSNDAKNVLWGSCAEGFENSLV